MKTTLLSILRTKTCTHLHILELKKKLITLRKAGIVYTTVDLVMLGEDEEFDLYLYATPAHASVNNPFPVPIHIMEHANEQLVRDFYFEYYKQEISSDQVQQYLLTKPYRGKEYIWYHRADA